MPFRFGIVTLTEAPQAFVHARIRLKDGREAEGGAAELLAPKWFDKDPALTNEQNFDQLRTSLAMARRALLAAGESTAFGLSAAVDGAHHAACATIGLNGLVASYGIALIDRAIIDAGSKVLTSDQYYVQHYGRLVDYPGAYIAALSEEHAIVDVSECRERPAVGQVVSVIPNHCCAVSNMVDEVYGVRNGKVEVVWPVAARGKVR